MTALEYIVVNLIFFKPVQLLDGTESCVQFLGFRPQFHSFA